MLVYAITMVIRLLGIGIVGCWDVQIVTSLLLHYSFLSTSCRVRTLNRQRAVVAVSMIKQSSGSIGRLAVKSEQM